MGIDRMSRRRRSLAVQAQLWLLGGSLVLVLGWWAAQASGRAEHVRVPSVHGDVISVYSRLHGSGLRVSTPRIVFDSVSPPQVVGTVPRAGRRVLRGSVVTLLLTRSPAPALAASGRLRSYRVPHLVGGGADAAYSWVRNKRLIFVAYLAPLKGGNAPGLLANWRISAQHPAPHSRLALGRRGKGARGTAGGLRPTPLSVWARPQPPLVSTTPPRSTTPTAATLAGSVDPEGEATSYYFAYGPTSAYGHATPAQQAGYGNGKVSVTAALGGLQPVATYHYRLVAHSSAGTVYGAGTTVTTPGYYQNPVYGAGPSPDPFVLDNGDTHSDYWAYTTGDKFQIFHSTDLVRWTPMGTALTTRPSWVVSSGDWNPWAPSVLTSPRSCPGTTSHGCYIMYYVGLSGQLAVHCIGVATSPTPGGPFTDQGPLDVASGTTPGLPLGCGDASGRGNIDPSPFVDSSGQAYLYVSTDNACAGGSCTFKPTISVIPLSSDYLTASGPRVPLFSGDPGTWEAVGSQVPVVEGPSMTLHNGTYYLLYSGGNWRSAYGTGYATSSSPTGPFSKSSSNPFLAQTATVLSPGGGDQPVIGPHGGLWLVYHGRGKPDTTPRTLRLDQLMWVPGPGGRDALVAKGPTSTPQPVQP